MGTLPDLAVGVRLLRSAYTGDCMQILRASDKTTLNIGFDADGHLDTASIISFCSGTVGYVKAWYDQSGNGNNLINNSDGVNYDGDGSQPDIYNGGLLTVNGLASVRSATGTWGSSSGTADFVTYSHSIGTSKRMCLFAVQAWGALIASGSASQYGLCVNDTNPILAFDDARTSLIGTGGSGTSQVTLSVTTSQDTLYLCGVARTANGGNNLNVRMDGSLTSGSCGSGSGTATNLVTAQNGSNTRRYVWQSEILVWENSDQDALYSTYRANVQSYYGVA